MALYTALHSTAHYDTPELEVPCQVPKINTILFPLPRLVHCIRQLDLIALNIEHLCESDQHQLVYFSFSSSTKINNIYLGLYNLAPI